MSRVAEKIRLTHADFTLSGSAGIQFWKPLHLNGYDEEPPRKELKPFEKLFLAVLLDAVETLKRDPNDEQNKRNWAHSAAERWLQSDGRGYGIFGFLRICEHFEWSATWVRKKILEAVAKARQEPKRPKPQRMSVRGQYRRPSGPKPKRRDAYGVK